MLVANIPYTQRERYCEWNKWVKNTKRYGAFKQISLIWAAFKLHLNAMNEIWYLNILYAYKHTCQTYWICDQINFTLQFGEILITCTQLARFYFEYFPIIHRSFVLEWQQTDSWKSNTFLLLCIFEDAAENACTTKWD